MRVKIPTLLERIDFKVLRRLNLDQLRTISKEFILALHLKYFNV